MNIRDLSNNFPDMDFESVQISSQILSCFAQLIAVMPSEYYQHIDDLLLQILCVFATFGRINNSYNSARLGTDAMNCINEIMSKVGIVSAQGNEFIYKVYQKTISILQIIVTAPKPSNGGNNEPIDDLYVTKFIVFLKLFIQGHLGRFEKIIAFPVHDLLNLLQKFTVKMESSIECYIMLLDVWQIYLEYLQQSMLCKQMSDALVNGNKLGSDKEPIFDMFCFLLRSIQYTQNWTNLQQLDDTSICEDDQTELELFIHRSIEVIASIAEIYPNYVITTTERYLDDKLSTVCYGMEYFIRNRKQSEDFSLKIEASQHPLVQLHLNIQDLITTLQVFSRFSHFFVYDSFHNYFERTKTLFDKLCEMIQFMDINKLCDIQSSFKCCILPDFLSLKAQMLATFKAYIDWFHQFTFVTRIGTNGDVHSTKQINSQAEPFVSFIFTTCSSIICDIAHSQNVPLSEIIVSCSDKLFHSASLTLNTFSSKIYPEFVFKLHSVQRLLEPTVLSNIMALDTPTPSRISLVDQTVVGQSVTSLLILPWSCSDESSQEWDKRSLTLSHFINSLLSHFNNLDAALTSKIIKPPCPFKSFHFLKVRQNELTKCPNNHCRSLYILKKVIKFHADSPAKSKQLLYHSLSSSLECFNQLLIHCSLLHSTSQGCQVTEHILALFIQVFGVLLSQVPLDFIKRTIQTLFQIIQSHEVLSFTGQNGDTLKQLSGMKVIINFIKLLTLIVRHTASSSILRSLLPDIIDLTVVHIQNSLISNQSPAHVHFGGDHNDRHCYEVYCRLQQVYYQFLYDLVLSNNRFFLAKTGSQANKFNMFSSGDPSTTTTNDNNIKYFNIIMESIGQSFLQQKNIVLYKQNLDSLEMLNEKCRLYDKECFKQTYRDRFLYVFVNALFDHSMDILCEPIYGIIYHLAQVDFTNFREVFIPKFVHDHNISNSPSAVDKVLTSFKSSYNVSSHEMQIDYPTFVKSLTGLISVVSYLDHFK